MKIFFCEGCGKRLTDSDLESGNAVDKKMAGIFCQKCGAGVETQEASTRKASTVVIPHNNAAAGTVAVAPRNNRSSQTRVAPAAPQRTSGAHAIPRTVNRNASSSTMYFAIGGGALALVVIFGMLLRDAPTPPAMRTAKPSATAEPAPLPPRPQQTVQEIKSESPPRELPPRPDPLHGADSREGKASQALDEVRAFKGLDEKDVAGRVAALESFVKEYGDTMAGARARSMIANLKNPPTPAPTGDAINDPQVAFARGVEFAGRNDNESALKYYNRALELRPEFLEALVNRSVIRRALYDIDGSLADAEKAVRLNPNLWQTQSQIAICLLAMGRSEEALSAIQKARALHNQPDGLENYIRQQGQALAVVYQGKKLEGKTLTQSAEFDARGRYLIAAGRYAEGIKDMEEALKLDESAGPRGGFQWLMLAHEKSGNWKARLETAKRWAESIPQLPEALNACAWELLTSKDETLRDPKQALAYSKKAVEILPLPPAPILDTYALALFRNGQKEEAVAQERKAIEALPAGTTAQVRKEYEDRLKEFEGQ